MGSPDAKLSYTVIGCMLENLESICYNKSFMKEIKERSGETEEQSGIEKAEDGTSGNADQRLNRYLSELIHMQDSRLLKTADLQALNRKYQLQPQDIEKLAMLTERHLTRALEYKGRERWDNAIVETERALLFTPLDNNIRLDLAELYLNRSAKYGYLQKDLQRSEHQVNDALILEPENREARSFQKELKKLQDMLKGRENKKRYIPLLILVMLILAAAVYPRVRYLLRLRSSEVLPPVQSAESLQWDSREIAWVSSADLDEEFDFSLSERLLEKDSDTGIPSLSLAGYTEALKHSYEKLDVEVYYDDTSMGVIPLVSEEDAPLRVGETAVFSALFHPEGDPDTQKPLRFTIRERKRLHEDDPPGWEALEPYTATPLPHAVYLNVESRLAHMIEGYDRSYLFLDFRITNRGRQALERLDLSAQWRDEGGHVIAAKDLSFVEDKRLKLREGELRTLRLMFSMSKEESARAGAPAVILKRVEKEKNESQ